jgi:uncharacterized membrane protein
MKHLKTWLPALIIAALPLIYLAVIYRDLPERVATHFGLDGRADDFSNKSTLVYMSIILSLVSVGVWLLLRSLNRIDPKRVGKVQPSVFKKLAWIILVFIALLGCVVIRSSQIGKVPGNTLIFTLLGFLFCVMGNYLPQLKPNYFAGFRTPWSLNSENNWRITHQVAGKWWFWGGLVISLTSLVFNSDIAMVIFFITLAFMAGVPMYRSYQEFKKEQKNSAA